MSSLPKLLLFSKPPQAKDAKTRLRESTSLSEQHIAKLHGAFVSDTLSAMEAAKTVESSVFWAPPISDEELVSLREQYAFASHEKQAGEGFAERFDLALRQVRGDERSAVIVIGSDCPLISAELIDRASSIVSQGKAVLGPSPSGGFYLQGIPAGKAFPSFKDCAAYPSELRAMAELSRRESELHCLEFLYDVDVEEDLVSLCEHLGCLELSGQNLAKHSSELCKSLEVYTSDDNRKRRVRAATQ